jgi:tetratricopeptide (TPR) repeat protein
MISFAALAIGLVAAVPAQTDPAPGLRWETTLADGLRRAAAEKKLVFVDFWRDACPHCTRLEKITLVDEDVLRALADTVPVRAKNVENPEAVEKYGIGGFPTLLLLEPDGTTIDAAIGFHGPEEFLGWLATARGLHERIALFEERVRRDPTDLAAHLGLGRLQAGNGRWAEARACFGKVLAADPGEKRPESAEAHLEIGITWKRTGEYRKAHDEIARARELALAARPKPGEAAKEAADPKEKAPAPRAGEDPLDRILHELAGAMLLLTDRKAGAPAVLEEYDAKVVAPDPRRHAWVLLKLGNLRSSAGNREGARAAWKRCDELYPRSPEGRECREALAR